MLTSRTHHTAHRWHCFPCQRHLQSFSIHNHPLLIPHTHHTTHTHTHTHTTDDIVFLATDGVTDNFNPALLKLAKPAPPPPSHVHISPFPSRNLALNDAPRELTSVQPSLDLMPISAPQGVTTIDDNDSQDIAAVNASRDLHSVTQPHISLKDTLCSDLPILEPEQMQALSMELLLKVGAGVGA